MFILTHDHNSELKTNGTNLRKSSKLKHLHVTIEIRTDMFLRFNLSKNADLHKNTQNALIFSLNLNRFVCQFHHNIK